MQDRREAGSRTLQADQTWPHGLVPAALPRELHSLSIILITRSCGGSGLLQRFTAIRIAVAGLLHTAYPKTVEAGRYSCSIGFWLTRQLQSPAPRSFYVRHYV